MTLIKIEPGWVCCDCAQPVELVAPGAWWRHENGQGECGFRLMDDAYNEIEDRYYQSDDEEYACLNCPFTTDDEGRMNGHINANHPDDYGEPSQSDDEEDADDAE